MFKRLWILGFAFLLAACGGGGGGGTDVSGSLTNSGEGGVGTYVLKPEIYSPKEGIQAANLNQPRFMAFDGVGNLYVASGTDNQVVRIAANGFQTAISGFNGPVGVLVKNTDLYVTQTGGFYRVSLSGLDFTQSAINVSLSSPLSINCSNCYGLALDGNVIYAARGHDSSGSLFAYDTTYTSASSKTASPNIQANGLALAGTVLYATDDTQPANGNGLNVFSVSSVSNTLARLSGIPVGENPYAVVVASNGDLYISNRSVHTVTRIRKTSYATSVFLGPDRLCYPTGLAIRDGYLYVANEPGCDGQSRSKGFILRANLDLS